MVEKGMLIITLFDGLTVVAGHVCDETLPAWEGGQSIYETCWLHVERFVQREARALDINKPMGMRADSCSQRRATFLFLGCAWVWPLLQ
jgi:hypothetical protein